jgi:hypothetical protein
MRLQLRENVLCTDGDTLREQARSCARQFLRAACAWAGTAPTQHLQLDLKQLDAELSSHMWCAGDLPPMTSHMCSLWLA